MIVVGMLSPEVCVGETLDGFLESNQEIDIAVPFRGIVEKIFVVEGQSVKAGELLAELKKEGLDASSAAAKARADSTGKIRSVEALLVLRRNKLRTLLELGQKGSARQEEIERARADVQISEAELQTAREEKTIAALEYKRLHAEVEERRLKSPIDGVVVKIEKKEAELVGLTESASIMKIVQLNPLKVVYHVPPEQVGRFKAGQKVLLNVVGADGEVTGVVSFVSPVIDPDSGTVRVQVMVENQEQNLRSGSRCALALD